MKRLVILNLVLLALLSALLFCDPGPDPYGDERYETWSVNVVNKLSDPIIVSVEFESSSYGGDRSHILFIEPEGTDFANNYMRISKSSIASDGIRKISIFSPFIILEGDDIDKYVIDRETTIDDVMEGRENWRKFRFEVKEEYFDTGLKKRTSF